MSAAGFLQDTGVLASPDPAVKPAHKRPRLIRRLFRWIRDCLAVVGLLAIIYVTCFDLSVVVSGSMSPTLRGEGEPGSDWLLCEKVSYRFRNPRRWEIIWMETSDRLKVAKRVVGLPGERVSLRDRQVLIDGQPATVPSGLGFLRYYPFGSLHRGQEAACGDGYFCLGDDSGDSQDSRFEGPVSRNRIHGRAWLIVWPPGRIGFVNP